jgi:hypothetical protein
LRRVAAERRDRRPRLVEPRGGVAVSALDRSDDSGIGVAISGQQPRRLELDRERRQRVGEHVVQITRDPAALGERRRLGPRGARPLLLLNQLPRLLLMPLAQAHQVPDHEHESEGDVGPDEDEHRLARADGDQHVDRRDDRDDDRERPAAGKPDRGARHRGVGAEDGRPGRLDEHEQEGSEAQSEGERADASHTPRVEEQLDHDEARDEPAVLISGIWVPSSELPDWLNRLASALPIEHLSDVLHRAFAGGAALGAPVVADLAVLAAWALGGALLATKRFSWLPSTAG